MNHIGRIFMSAAVTLLAGCGGELAPPAQVVESSLGAMNGGAVKGTELTASGAWVVQCTGDATSNVVFGGDVISDGSRDSVEITASIDNHAPTQVGTIQPQDFSNGQQNLKIAPWSVTLPLADGSYSIEICFDQSGSQGRDPKHTCLPESTVIVACAGLTCDAMEPFGNLVGNPSLCKGKGPPHIPVHVRGDFGDHASLTISGPNGFSHTTEMSHAGDSCNYHYNWNAAGHGGTGTYTFTVSGNGEELVFSAELGCGQ